jgi:hypothetical protein
MCGGLPNPAERLSIELLGNADASTKRCGLLPSKI